MFGACVEWAAYEWKICSEGLLTVRQSERGVRTRINGRGTMRFIKPLVMLMLVGFILSINVSYADMSDARSLFDIKESIRHRYLNVSSMLRAASHGDEFMSVIIVQDNTLIIEIMFNDLLDSEVLLAEMKNAPDKLIVKDRIGEHVAKLKIYCPDVIEKLNTVMPALYNSAILSEVQQARDEITRGCDLAQHWK